MKEKKQFYSSSVGFMLPTPTPDVQRPLLGKNYKADSFVLVPDLLVH